MSLKNSGKGYISWGLSTSLLRAKATMSLRLTRRNGMRRHGRKSHIPPNLVVGPWVSHTTLDTTTRYPHHVLSSPTAICMEMRHGTECQTDTPKPHHHRRFPR